MRKINKNEIKAVSRHFAEIFEDYDLYDLYIPRDEQRQNRIYYLFRYEIFVSAESTYTLDDDYRAMATIKLPGDGEKSPARLFANPFFSVAFFHTFGLKVARSAYEYVKFTANAAKKHYNPSTDCYIKNIGVAKSARGQGLLRKMIDEICGGRPVYLETHSAENVKIYQKLGFVLLETLDFHGINHYMMKRAAV